MWTVEAVRKSQSTLKVCSHPTERRACHLTGLSSILALKSSNSSVHYSSLASITEAGVRLHSDLLTPLSIREGARAWAAFYPQPERSGYPRLFSCHDIMLTPVPFECWPFAARFRFFLKQDVHGGLDSLIKALRKLGFSLICSEASRSGHRFATCTTTVSVDSVKSQFPGAKQMAGDIEEYNNAVSKAVFHAVSTLNRDCQDFLFFDTDALGLEEPIKAERLDSIGYFWAEIQKARQEDKFQPYSEPWCFTRKGIFLEPNDTTKEFMKMALNDSIPSRVFAEINTREAQMRLAVLPLSLLKSFAWVEVAYEHNKLDACASTGNGPKPIPIEQITEVVSRSHNIWRYFLNIRALARGREDFSAEYFVNCINKEPVSDNHSSSWNLLKSSIETLGSHSQARGAQLITAKITPLSCKQIFLSLKMAHPRRDELRNICAEAGATHGIFDDDVVLVENYTDPVLRTVEKKIDECYAVIQYYDLSEIEARSNEDYQWLIHEYAYARAKGKRIVRIFTQAAKNTLQKTSGDTSPITIKDRPSNAEIKDAMSRAMQELHNGDP
jgi:hypothetical protein